MKIGLILTGGTVGSAQNDTGYLAPEPNGGTLLERYREKTGDRTPFPVFCPYTILSENLSFPHLKTLYETVRQALHETDALIVSHGTDTLSYSAAALSYMFGLSEKPIVLVSSNYILSDRRSNGLANFCAAVDFLRNVAKAHGVYVSYRNGNGAPAIFRGATLLTQPALSDSVLSPRGPAFCMAPNGRFRSLPGYTESADCQPPFPADGLPESSEKVLFLHAHPGMALPDTLKDMKAVLLETYHSGTLPTTNPSIRRFSKTAKESGIPVFLTGVGNGTPYESTAVYAELGFTPLPGLSPVAAYMKLCLCLAAERNPRTDMPLPLGGDL